MYSFDYDKQVQDIFNTSFSDYISINWRDWLDISSIEDYEELSLKLSGLSSIENIEDRIKNEITDSRSFSIDLESFLDKTLDSDSLIFCHTSGTTNSDLSKLKWFHMTKEVVKRQWAPGMQAIFESSGLDSNSSAIIFVPSRLKFDGIRTIEDNKFVSLYSSEFSQRIMLSIIKPNSYLLYEYRNSRSLEIITKVLTLENISVISAPALTILGWADINKLQDGIRRSLDFKLEPQNPIYEELLLKIKRNGLEQISKEIQIRLSEKLNKATIVFSISSLSKNDWDLIRKFMKWKKGEEKFTNLYVASEIGPFAASINKGDYGISQLNQMYIFPLTIPVIEHKGKKELVSKSKKEFGRLFVSRLNDSKVLVNIDIGDVIHITKRDGLPQMEGKILRSQFQLKYPINISNQVGLTRNYNSYAGDYFEFNGFEIIEPRSLLNHLKMVCSFPMDALLLIKNHVSEAYNWTLIIPSDQNGKCTKKNQIKKIILDYEKPTGIKQAIKNRKINIKIIKDQPVNFLATREAILTQVRNGKLPKGILKKWPLYIIELT